MKKVLVLNLTPRWGMLHYSSQFCNELSKYVDLKVAIAYYYNENLYRDDIEFIKIKTNPNLKSFIFDTLFFWNHIIFIYKILKFNPETVHFIDNHPWYIFYSKLFKGEIINIEKMEPLDETSIYSSGPAMYTIEANREFFARHTIKPGDTIKLLDPVEYNPE